MKTSTDSPTIVRTTTMATDDNSSDDDMDDEEDDSGDDDCPAPSSEGIFSPFSTPATRTKKSVNERLGKPVIAEAQTTTVTGAKTAAAAAQKGTGILLV